MSYSRAYKKEDIHYSFDGNNLKAKSQQGQYKREKLYIILIHKYRWASPKCTLENQVQQCTEEYST